MFIKKLTFYVFLFVTVIIYAQTLHYDITSNTTPIGRLDVTKTVHDNIVQIEVVSKVNVKLFIDVDFAYQLNCTYKSNELIYSSVTTYVNGKIHSTSNAEKKGAYYTVTKNGHTSKFINKITFSGALLYYREPVNIETIFSEFDNVEKPIRKINSHEYQVTNPKDGRLSEYFYKNGVLEKAINHHKLITFTLIKKE